MFLRFEENPNTGFVDDRVFQERSEPRVVTHVLRLRAGQEVWCPVTGLAARGIPVPALARKVEDSGEGMCYLVYGGLWGLRLQMPNDEFRMTNPPKGDIRQSAFAIWPWSLDDPHQWGEPFLLLPADGADLRLT